MRYPVCDIPGNPACRPSSLRWSWDGPTMSGAGVFSVPHHLALAHRRPRDYSWNEGRNQHRQSSTCHTPTGAGTLQQQLQTGLRRVPSRTLTSFFFGTFTVSLRLSSRAICSLRSSPRRRRSSWRERIRDFEAATVMKSLQGQSHPDRSKDC